MSKRTTRGRQPDDTGARYETEIRHMIQTVNAIRGIDIQKVLREYKTLMTERGYEHILDKEEQYQDGFGSDVVSVQRGSDKEGQIRKLTSQLQDVQSDLAKRDTEMQEKNKLLEELMNNKHRNANSKELENENKQIKEVIEEMDSEMRKMQVKYRAVKSDLEEANKGKAEALTRLSKIMGSKLTDNNPSISDLSDDNRALKLAEKYSELYDNQWTEAIEKLEYEGTDEDTSVNVLLHIAKKSFNCCKLRADYQMSQLEKLLHSPGSRRTTQLNKENKKLLKDCRKAAAADATESICEEVAYDLSNSRLVQYTKHLKVFVQKCAELFWMMCVQDPPLALGPEPGTGDKLDATYYKHYTRTGTTVQYIVWPPLLLYENGPILCKGVAQPFKVQKNNDLKPNRNPSKMMLPNVSSDGELIKATSQYYYDTKQYLLPRSKTEIPQSTYFQEDMVMHKSTHSPQVHRKAWDDNSHNSNSRGRIQNIHGTTSTYSNT